MDPAPVKDDSQVPVVTRIRHELTRRTLTVSRVERLPPGMVRIVLSGEELPGFSSLGFDDHIKLFFPPVNERQGLAPAMRDFTPRRFMAEQGELWIDFFLHEGGPATDWAARASVGQTLQIAGPKGSSIIAPDGIDMHLLIGDETALPAISRRLEELPPSARALVVSEVDASTERPRLESQAAVQFIWVVRSHLDGPPAQAIIEALNHLELPPGRCFAWVACESRSARAIRAYLRDERRFDRKWIKAAGYWQQGAAGAHDSIPFEA
jgi:NADPH-dependent ferric siderophore reductase